MKTNLLAIATVMMLSTSGCLGRITEEERPVLAAEAGPDASGGGAGQRDGGAQGSEGGTCWQAAANAPSGTGPSGRVGGCSLAGTWKYDVTFSGPGQPSMAWSFDDEGRAVGGPAGTNVCSAFRWYGNYTLGDAGFAAKNIRGEGAPGCGSDGETTFRAEFSADCRTMTLPEILTDSCTGGALFYTGTLTRVD